MRVSITFLPILAFVSIIGCSGGGSESVGSNDDVSVDSLLDQEDADESAILLWDASIYSSTGKDKKWLATYKFGVTLTLTGNTADNQEEDRTYVEVIGPDDKKGWINQYLLFPQAEIGVVTTELPLYKNPDIMSITKNTIAPAELIAISKEEKNGFYEVLGKEKKVKGYTNSAGVISRDADDLQVALFFKQAMEEENVEKRVEALQKLVDDGKTASSAIYPAIQDKIRALQASDDFIDSIPADDVDEDVEDEM